MKCIIATLISFMVITPTAYAGGFQDAQNMAAQHSSPPSIGAVNGNTIPGYTTASPPEVNFNNPSALSNASTRATATDPSGAGAFIQNSATARPQFNITGNDSLIQGATAIQAKEGQLSGLNPTDTNGCQNVTTTNPAVYDTYTCTKSNTIINPICNTSLSVTPKITQSCAFGTRLNRTSISGIVGPFTYWPGTMSFTANCGAASERSDIIVALANPGGNCDNFRTYKNLGHLNLQITPQTTKGKETFLGNIYMVKHANYFYCISPAQVYYTFRGCNKNNLCTLDFRVDDKRPPKVTCSDGSRVRRGRRGRPRCFCSRKQRKARNCPVIVKTPIYLYKRLTWTQNHGVTSFVDTWNALPCQ